MWFTAKRAYAAVCHAMVANQHREAPFVQRGLGTARGIDQQ